MNDAVHVIVDIETLGIKPGCGVWNIGAVVLGPMVSLKYFSAVANPGSCRLGKHQSTIRWQETTNAVNWQRALQYDTGDEETILRNFMDFLDVQPVRNTVYWSQGNFDYPILEAALKFYDLEPPWKFWQCMDLRTLEYWYRKKHRKPEGAHDALVDAKCEAEFLQEVLDQREQMI